jgi:hypothetical protein
MLGILKDNLYAVAAYWWVIVVGVVMPFLDLLKFLHPTKHWEFKLHPSLRIAIAALALIIAEFLAYKDQASNLAAVIEAKRQLSMQLNSKNTEIAQLQQQTVGAVPSASGAAVLKILYHGQSLDGLEIDGITAPLSESFSLDGFQTKNTGSRTTMPVSARLYFKQAVGFSLFGSGWQPTESDDKEFPYEWFCCGPIVRPTVNAGETWNWPAISGNWPGSNWPVGNAVSARIKFFYGSKKPAIANFIIRKAAQPAKK